MNFDLWMKRAALYQLQKSKVSMALYHREDGTLTVNEAEAHKTPWCDSPNAALWCDVEHIEYYNIGGVKYDIPEWRSEEEKDLMALAFFNHFEGAFIPPMFDYIIEMHNKQKAHDRKVKMLLSGKLMGA